VKYNLLCQSTAGNACSVVKSLLNVRFLDLDNVVPTIPVSGCNAEFCNCKFARHADRRDMGPLYIDPKGGRYRMHFLENPALDNNRDIFTAALDATISRLVSAGKELILVIDWPGLGFDPKACADIRPVRLTSFKPIDCRFPRRRYDARAADYLPFAKPRKHSWKDDLKLYNGRLPALILLRLLRPLRRPLRRPLPPRK
jgi:hypothetical protein